MDPGDADCSMRLCYASGKAHRSSVYWWNSQIAAMKKECLVARRKWQKAKTSTQIDMILELEEIYRAKKKDLRCAIKKAKASAWEELLQTIEQDPWGLPYRIVVKKLRRSSPSLTETLELDVLTKTVDKLFPDDPE